MKELKDHSIEDMKAEIARRTRPKARGMIEASTKLRLGCMITDRANGEFEESQIHYFWEETMKEVYGVDVFDWWNAQESS